MPILGKPLCFNVLYRVAHRANGAARERGKMALRGHGSFSEVLPTLRVFVPQMPKIFVRFDFHGKPVALGNDAFENRARQRFGALKRALLQCRDEFAIEVPLVDNLGRLGHVPVVLHEIFDRQHSLLKEVDVEQTNLFGIARFMRARETVFTKEFGERRDALGIANEVLGATNDVIGQRVVKHFDGHAENGVRFIEKFPPSTVFVKTFFGTPLPSEVGAVVLVLRDARFA